MRIDLLLTSRSGFSYENYAAKRITEEFEKRGVPHKKIFLSDGIFNDYIRYVEEDPPHSILSFDPILPYETPLCDLVEVPQVIWAKSSLSEAAHFLQSRFGRVCLPTPTRLSKTFYLPHGVEARTQKESLFDVVFFSPLVDTTCLRERWSEFFSVEVIEIIEKSLCSEKPLYTIFREASFPISLCHTIEAVEEFERAERAYQVITHYKGNVLDVFGEHIGSNWYRRLPNSSTIHLHASLPYAAHFDVLAQSKIVILDPLDCSWELPAAASGCLPLFANRQDLNEQIALYLGDSKKREKALDSYQERITAQNWEIQSARLIEILYEN
jgi:hypothetical protein